MADFTVTIADIHIPRIKEAYRINGELPTNIQLRNILVSDCKHSIKNKVIQYESNKARDEAILAQEQLEI